MQYQKKFIENIEMNSNVVHISHTDLDGYSCSYLVKKYLPTCNLTQHNVNYGEVINLINKLDPDSFIIVTDVNLTLEECELMDKTFNDWIVIDHHGTGKDSYEAYPNNYYLDTSKCATKLTYDLFDNLNIIDSKLTYDLFDNLNVINSIENNIGRVVDIINAYDIYLTNKSEFRMGMLMNNYAYENPFEFPNMKHNYIKFIIENIGQSLLHYGVKETELNYQDLFNSWLSSNFDRWYINDDKIPTNVRVAMAHENGVLDRIVYEDDFLTVFIGVSTKITQYVNELLFKDNRFKNKVLINLNAEKGTVAFRSINERASHYAVLCGGGGHPNAGGAKIKLNEDKEPLNILLQLLGV